MTWARARCGHHLIGAAEDVLHAAAERNDLVADDGQRQCWATIRSGLSKGLLRPIDLDADDRLGVRRRRRRKRPLDEEESGL